MEETPLKKGAKVRKHVYTYKGVYQLLRITLLKKNKNVSLWFNEKAMEEIANSRKIQKIPQSLQKKSEQP